MIVRESWELLKKDKEIMWFPVLSSIASIIAFVVLGAMFFFASLGGEITDLDRLAEEGTTPIGYAVLLIFYVTMFFITNFFTAGIFIIAHGRFTGRDLTFSDGLNGAMENSGKIFVWSLISATVGIVLGMISDRSKLLGKLVAVLLGAPWAIMTYFSLPAIVIGKKSIGESFKESASVIRKTWGETIVVNFGVGLFFALLTFFGIAFIIGVAFLIPSFSVLFGMLALFIVYVIGLSIISSTLGAIFKLALYEYATTGRIPQGFSPALIQHAVRAA
jgi:hypothetical protein